MPKTKTRTKKKKGLPRPDEHFENDPPTGEYRWLDGINTARDPSDPDSTPSGLKGMSGIGALAWVRKNCKFAKGLAV